MHRSLFDMMLVPRLGRWSEEEMEGGGGEKSAICVRVDTLIGTGVLWRTYSFSSKARRFCTPKSVERR